MLMRKNIGSLKYFIMPNKRIRKQHQSAGSCLLSTIVGGAIIVSFCWQFHLSLAASSASSSIGANQPKPSVSSSRAAAAASSQAPATSTLEAEPLLVRLEGDRVALECPLLPSGLGRPFASVESRRRRRRRESIIGGQQSPMGGRTWPPLDGPQQQQQVASKIDEMPARAAAAMGPPQWGRAGQQEDSVQEEEEAIELILWYRNSQSIYSVDARNRRPLYGSPRDSLGGPSAATAATNALVPVSPAAHLHLEANWELEPEPELELEQLETELATRQLNYSKGAKMNNNKTTTTSDPHWRQTSGSAKQRQAKLWPGPKEAKHYALASMSARMRLAGANASAYLIIDKLRPTDSAQYKCRVDFRQAPTRYQSSQLQVISPVRQLQISAASEGAKLDLWPQQQQRPDDKVGRPGMELVQANEDRVLQLECSAANEGWPKAELVWLQIDWFAKEPRVEQLASSAIRGSLQTRPNNATKWGPQNNPPSRLLVQLQLAASNLINAQTAGDATMAEGAGWSSWWSDDIALRLGPALSRLSDKLKHQQRISDLHSVQASAGHDADDDYDDDGMKARQLAADWLAGWLTVALRAEPKAEQQRQQEEAQPPPEVGRFLSERRPRLLTCLASSTGPLLAGLRDGRISLAGRQRDKLAQIGPAHRSILVEPVAKARAIQMFLVGRRKKDSGEQIELTKLPHQNGLHLNLAQTLDGAASKQIQLACLVSGSIPRSTIRWNQIGRSAPATRRNTNQAAKGRKRLESNEDLAVTTAELWEATKSINTSESNNGAHQWSFVKVQNISIHEHHRAVIECSAYNDKYHKTRGADHSDANKSRMDVSASVVLNVTHQPVVSLELELKSASIESNYTSTRGETTTAIANLDQEEVVAVYGQEVGLLCRVSFANPPTIGDQPIEWLLNDTLLDRRSLAQVPDEREMIEVSSSTRVQIISRQLVPLASTQDNEDGSRVEKLIVRFERVNQDANHNRVGSSLVSELKGASSIGHDFGNNGGENYDNVDQPLMTTSSVGTQLAESSASRSQQSLLVINCRAQNTLGQGLSNGIKITIGQLPSCSSSPANLNVNEQQRKNQVMATSTKATSIVGADKMKFRVHCPVISDKSSSRYHWSWLAPNQIDDNTGTRSSVRPGKTSELAELSLADLVEMGWLAGTKHGDGGNNNNNNNLTLDNDVSREDKITIICHASDRFGSNDKNPCRLTVFGLGEMHSAETPTVGDSSSELEVGNSSHARDIPLGDENCAAKIAQHFPVQKRQPTLKYKNKGSHQTILATNLEDVDDDSDGLNHTSPADFDLNPPRKSSLSLTIQCDNPFSGPNPASSLLGHQNVGANLYLYNRDRAKNEQPIKHLARIERLNLGEKLNTSLVLGLEDDNHLLEQLVLRDFQQDHAIVMSFYDQSDNEIVSSPHHRHANITIGFINDLEPKYNPLARNNIHRNPQPIDRFPRTSDYVHRDRLWVITGLCAVFISSFVFVLVLWAYRKSAESKRHQGLHSGTGSQLGRKNQGSTKREPNSISDQDKFCPLTGADQEQQQQQQRQQQDFHHYQKQLANDYHGGEQSARLAIYHNGNHNGIELQDRQVGSQPLNNGSNIRATTLTEKVNDYKIAESTVISNSPYDFVIIDQHHHTLSPDSQSTATTSVCDPRQQGAAAATTVTATSVLLLDTDGANGIECTTCNLHYPHEGHCKCREVEPSRSPSAYAHIQSVPPPQCHHGGGATLRCYCSNDPVEGRDLQGPSGGIVMVDNNWPGSPLDRNSTRCSSHNYHLHHSLASNEYFDVQTMKVKPPSMSDNKTSSVVRSSPFALLPLAATSQATSPALAGFNLELNSQGEMTLTDESSSFIHEDGSGNSGDHQFVVCYACRRSDNLNSQQQPVSSIQGSQVLLRPCSECRRSDNNNDLNHLNFDGATYVLSSSRCTTSSVQSHSPPTSSSQSPTLQASTLKRRRPSLLASSSSLRTAATTKPATTNSDRVRFVDFDPGLSR